MKRNAPCIKILATRHFLKTSSIRQLDLTLFMKLLYTRYFYSLEVLTMATINLSLLLRFGEYAIYIFLLPLFILFSYFLTVKSKNKLYTFFSVTSLYYLVGKYPKVKEKKKVLR